MNEEQMLRLKIASEQMAALVISRAHDDWPAHVMVENAISSADRLIAQIERMPEGE